MHGQTLAEVGAGGACPGRRSSWPSLKPTPAAPASSWRSGKFRWLGYPDARLIRSLGASKRAFSYFRSRWLQSPDGRMWGAANAADAPEAEAAPGGWPGGCRCLRSTLQAFLR